MVDTDQLTHLIDGLRRVRRDCTKAQQELATLRKENARLIRDWAFNGENMSKGRAAVYRLCAQKLKAIQ